MLLDGKLTAKNPESDYSQAQSVLDDTAVVAVYTNNVVDISSEKTVIVNASGFDSVIVKNADGKDFIVKSCKGEIIAKGKISGIPAELPVSRAGIVFIG